MCCSIHFNKKVYITLTGIGTFPALDRTCIALPVRHTFFKLNLLSYPRHNRQTVKENFVLKPIIQILDSAITILINAQTCPCIGRDLGKSSWFTGRHLILKHALTLIGVKPIFLYTNNSKFLNLILYSYFKILFSLNDFCNRLYQSLAIFANKLCG